MKNKALIVWCTPEQHARIKAVAAAIGVPIAQLLRELINAGWEQRFPRPPTPMPPPPPRVNIDREAKRRLSLSWLPADGSWSSPSAPWTLVGMLVSSRRDGLCESEVVRDYPVILRWRLTEAGKEWLRDRDGSGEAGQTAKQAGPKATAQAAKAASPNPDRPNP